MNGLDRVHPRSSSLPSQAVQTSDILPLDGTDDAQNFAVIDDDLAFVKRLPLPRSLDQSGWVERAWCLQEQILSQRFLVFWDGQVYWQCRNGMEFEDMSEEYQTMEAHDHHPHNRSDPPRLPLPRVASLGINLGSTQMDGSSSWRRTTTVLAESGTLVMRTPLFIEYISVVGLYSSRRLTKDTDALNAVNGLLSLISSGLDAEMLSGLPETLLDVALLWTAKEPLRRRQCDVPSWTWAGWEGRVGYSPTVEYQERERTLVPSKNVHQERVRPFVLWYKILENKAPVRVNGTGAGVKVQRMPPDWCAAETRPDYVHPTKVTAPAPSLGRILLQTWTMCCLDVIDCLTEDAVPLHPGQNGAPAGELSLDQGSSVGHLQREARLKNQTLALIVLSEAQWFHGQELNKKFHLFEFVDQYYIYNVMLVMLDPRTGAATRRGVGKVYKHAWNLCKPEWKWIRLI